MIFRINAVLLMMISLSFGLQFNNNTTQNQLLSRKKRLAAFPLGSSFSCSMCMTVGVVGNPNYQFLSMGLNWGIGYDLPNETWVLDHAKGFKKKETVIGEATIKRRNRRDTFEKLEKLFTRNNSKESKFQRINENSSFVSRQKRYVAFPEGSSLSVAVCATVGVVGNPNPGFLSFGMNWGVAFDLPNSTWILRHVNGFKNSQQPLSVLQRRNKRNLFRSIEIGLEKMGYNGRDCIMRALCESKQFFVRKGHNMIEEMLRKVFSLPKAKVLSRERREFSEIEDYDRAYRQSGTLEECEYSYPGCNFSLLDLALGKYSNPAMNFFAAK